MVSQPQSAPRFDFDFGPAFKMYMENLEKWRKSYEQLAQVSRVQPAYTAEAVSPNYDKAVGQWQKTGEELVRRFVEQQIELCRFFEKRWEQYLSLSDQLAQCRSAIDYSQAQLAFMNQLASDYARESGKFMQPMNELMAGWTRAE